MKLRQFISLLLVSVMFITSNSIFAVAYDETEEPTETLLISDTNDNNYPIVTATPDQNSNSFSVSEYEMVLNRHQEWINAQTIQAHEKETDHWATGPDPLEEFQKSFNERAALPEDILSGYGYSDEKISILKQYENGEIPFEVAAISASATLHGDFYCGTHTTTKYSLTYDWEWDAVPTGLGRDGIGLGVQGINKQSDGFNTKIDSSVATVTYYYMTGTRYRSENVSKTSHTNKVSATFDSYKLTDSGDRWVWAKKGYLTMTISPTVSGGTTFAAVRARGEYLHASNNKLDYTISVTVNIFTGDITISAAISNGEKGDVTPMGERQGVYYNDGSYFDES